jgi:hypothetical protein
MQINKTISSGVLDAEKNVRDKRDIEDVSLPLFLLGKCAYVLDVLDNYLLLVKKEVSSMNGEKAIATRVIEVPIRKVGARNANIADVADGRAFSQCFC